MLASTRYLSNQMLKLAIVNHNSSFLTKKVNRFLNGLFRSFITLICLFIKIAYDLIRTFVTGRDRYANFATTTGQCRKMFSCLFCRSQGFVRGIRGEGGFISRNESRLKK